LGHNPPAGKSIWDDFGVSWSNNVARRILAMLFDGEFNQLTGFSLKRKRLTLSAVDLASHSFARL